jgi:hypothetical protein
MASGKDGLEWCRTHRAVDVHARRSVLNLPSRIVKHHVRFPNQIVGIIRRVEVAPQHQHSESPYGGTIVDGGRPAEAESQRRAARVSWNSYSVTG